MKKTLAIFGILTFLATTSIAQNEKKETPTGTDHHKNRKKRGEILASIPNLSEEQKTQINQIQEEGRKKTQPLRNKTRQIREKLRAIKIVENPNISSINELIDKCSKLKAETEKLRTLSEIKIRALLTPEQRKVLDAKRKEKR